MRYLSVGEMHGEREVSRELYTRSGRRVFAVLVDTMRASPNAILLAPGLPRLGDPWACDGDVDVGVFVVRVRPRQTNEPRRWLVDIEYSTEIDLGALDLAPWEKQPEMAWSTERVEEAIIADINGDPITNSSGQLYNPPVPGYRFRPALEITRNEMFFHPHTFRFLKTLNKEEFIVDGTTFPAKTCYMHDIRARQTSFGGTFYWQVNYTIHIDELNRPLSAVDGVDILDEDVDMNTKVYIGHKARLLNTGTLVLDINGNQIIPTDRQGRAKPEVLLDTNGFELPGGQDPLFREFDVFEAVDWRPLRLPNPGSYDPNENNFAK